MIIDGKWSSLLYFFFFDFFVSLLAYNQLGGKLLADKCVMIYLSDMLERTQLP